MKKLVMILVVILTSQIGRAQLNGANWIFGLYDNAIIHFSNETATADSFPSNLKIFVTSACINDSSGNLLFYSNGPHVNNRLGAQMQNGFDLSPELKTFTDWYYGYNEGYNDIQANIALPKPNSDSEYYLLQVDYDSSLVANFIWRPEHMMLNVINMNADSGKGDVVIKNKMFFTDTMSYSGMTACRHANGRDWWLVRNEYLSNCYYLWLITPDSIYGPTKQCLGLPNGFPDGNSNFDFSPDGSHFANTVSSNNKFRVNLFDFDRCTGELSNPIILQYPDSCVALSSFRLGCNFSSNGRFLYALTSHFIYQYDLEANDIQASEQQVAHWIYNDSLFALFAISQKGMDGKIYIDGVVCNPYLSVINAPDSQGLASAVSYQNFYCPTLSSCGLPNMPNYQLGALSGSACDTLTTADYWIQSNEIKSLRIIPNPNDGRFAASYQLPQNKEGMLTITNELGEVVYRERRPQWSSICNINASKLSKGIYLVTLECGGNRRSAKLVKQ